MKDNIGNHLLNTREIKELPNILGENETPIHALYGIYEGGAGALVATNRRFIFIDKGIFKLKVEDFPYDKVASIQFNSGLMSRELTIYASGNSAKITHVDKTNARKLVDWARNYISNSETGQPIKPAAQTNDVIQQLKDLAELKNQGILTEEEFQTQKTKILGS